MDETLQGYHRYFVTSLTRLYGADEAEAIARIVFSEKLLIRPHYLHIIDKTLLISELNMLEDILQRLLNYEPMQYVLGNAHFFDLRFKVTPDVLIPRRETEELVDMVLKEWPSQQPVRLLDIGTGSGCIPVTIACRKPGNDIVALDVSPAALRVAADNASANHARIRLIRHDVLTGDELNEPPFDIIVSNPPYITIEEKAGMSANVLRYEPHLALFVTNNDPLQFYRAITAVAVRHLAPEGRLYLELNEIYGKDVPSLLSGDQFTDVKLHYDLQNKTRFLTATRL
jgi:release factor glutamine methyltransferase